MITVDQMKRLIDDCHCGDLRLQVCTDGGRSYLQVSDGAWTGRKWNLSPHMVPGEVVQTALAAVLAWYEHEAREQFKFQGRAIFSPHLSLETLWQRAFELEVRG